MPRYANSERLTIRGEMEVSPNNKPSELLVFNYESPDRTRGWIIEGAWMWISDVRSPTTLTGDSSANLVANLATDRGAGLTENQLTNSSENRSIGWMQKQWLGKNVQDFWIPNSVSLTGCDFLLDLDRIVTNSLFLNAYFQHSGTEDIPSLTLSYMISLREISLTPSQSLLQQLKGIGQDIDN